jgi:type II secretory pathway pseudopilin PulG
MVTSIVLALIAAVSGLLSSLWTLQRQQKANERLAALHAELAARTRAEERQLAGKELLDNHREPLIAAAEDLKDRIFNIRQKNFRWYYHPTDSEWRSRVALLGTLFRFGKYWSVVDQL